VTVAKIEVVVVKADDPVPKLELIENDLETFQQTVGGGLVQCVPLHCGGRLLNLWCDEEGLLKGLPPNRPVLELRQWIHGTFFITGQTSRGGDSTSVPSALIPWVIDRFVGFLGLPPSVDD
jgi:hypothetical protein